MESIPGFDPQAQGAACRFDDRFVERSGGPSRFIATLSDLWTIALFRILERNGMTRSGIGPRVCSTEEAVRVLRGLCAADAGLKTALFEEPFGFGEPGAIEREFERAFGPGEYLAWREAFEDGRFDECRAMTERKASE